MNILLANDDGIESEGIRILAEKLTACNHKVYIIAPHENRSAVSHGTRIFDSIKLRKVKENTWACSGLPADCVSAGLISDVLGCKIDAVLSGINYGANLGSDIIYSGTCAAARQAVLNEVPAVALSVDPIDWEEVAKTGFKFSPLAEFVAKNLEKLISLSSVGENRCFVNVNAPNMDSYKGVKFAETSCHRIYRDSLNFTQDEDGWLSSKIQFGNSKVIDGSDVDFTITRAGYISVSRVLVDPIFLDSVDGIDFSL